MSDQLVLQNETTATVINRVNADYWKDKNILITGITGFVGSWLTEILSSSKINANIYGLLRRQSNPNLRNIQHLLDRENIKLIKGDLQDLGSIVNAIKESDADVIYHLAAQSFVPHSFASPIDTYSTNVTGTLNMLEALRLTPGNVALHYAGSSEEYGLVLQNNQHYKTMLDKYKTILPSPNLDSNNNVVNEAPIKETNPLRTVGTSPYGSSKRQAEDACRTYVSCYGLDVHITRAFNHTGPRRGNEFVTSEITRQIAQGIKENRKNVTLGNLDSIRDFTDVRDTVMGYLAVIEKGTKGDVYNLASGKGISIAELLEISLTIAREHYKVEDMKYLLDESRLRPTDLPVLIGDASKAKEKLGWNNHIPLNRTILEMIQYHLSLMS
ncbi:MAG: GDP-mannose 4,6-dehydratase [Nitrososphaerales archaeon]|nr:GDP-mannose 4,6-dehydratase [Nitrososphaerales archaeon]